MWKYASKRVLLHIKKWKTNRNEVTYNSCIKSKIRRKFENLRKACKKKISEFIFNLIPRVSNLYGTFDDEGLLHGHYYWKSERPGDIKLPDRQFLIPHKNKKHGFVKGLRFCSYLLKLSKESWGNIRGLLGTRGDNFLRIS